MCGIQRIFASLFKCEIMPNSPAQIQLTEEKIKEQLLNDYRLACVSREASLLGRKEVLTGKAKFGIFGDGKELAQIALAKHFRKGDFRSGYYRDQTIMMALDLLSVKEYFAALYAHVDINHEPASGGRQMGGHYATRNLDDHGNWKNLMEQYNSSADISPTAGQMPRLLGLAQASKVYRALGLKHLSSFSDAGNEIAFGTIGDASTSEGLFWESMNAAAVLQVPMVMSVWDDGYGISVPKKYQTTKESISEALSGFEKGTNTNGFRIFKVKGWNYPELLMTYEKATKVAREEHIPVLVHVEDMTQPQGHSTSGSHERYKTKGRLAWAEEYDCIAKFKEFLILEGSASEKELDDIRKASKKTVRAAQKEAWNEFRSSIDAEKMQAMAWLQELKHEHVEVPGLEQLVDQLEQNTEAIRKEIVSTCRQALILVRGSQKASKTGLKSWLENNMKVNQLRYSSHLYSESKDNALHAVSVPAEYDADPEQVDGRLVLKQNFEVLFSRIPELITFGEDTGVIGGVNQAMEGMQGRFGEVRVSDTGIREATIIGQGIGMAMRGLRPLAEIQYLDYLYYALQIMRDDLATVQYRTKGGQKAPLIIRTRGHRLEGIWHSGSPMGAIINSIRGMYVCVPRNMVQAAGMYNLLLQSDDPAIVVECLNGYRSKEALPKNLGDFTVPLGMPEVVREGSDITVVSYGSTFNLCQEAAVRLEALDIDVELVDVQTLLPFDREGMISKSIEKTNRVIFIDEDVPGGASAYMMDQVINGQDAWKYLDAKPQTLSAQPHLPAYSTDGDYFSKPSVDDIVEAIYNIMHESAPALYPSLG